jgi:predicted dinucleotide-utilizing enzyme
VIDGLSDGLSQAALATKMAVSESVASSKSFADEDLQKVVADVKTLKEMYLQTMSEALGKLKNLTASQLGDLQAHAATAQKSVLPAFQSAFEAAYNHPVEFGKESVQTGFEFSRQSVGGLFSAVGKLLQDAGQRIQSESPAAGDAFKNTPKSS